MDEKILLIDSTCPYCTIFGKAVKKDFEIFSVQSEIGIEFCEEVFGRPLLELVLYDPSEEKVYVGEDAVEKVIREKIGVGSFFGGLTYDSARDLIAIIQNRNSSGLNKTVHIDKDLTGVFNKD